MKKIILTFIFTFSVIASAGVQNIMPSWITADTLPKEAVPTVLSIVLTSIGNVEIKALVTNERTLSHPHKILNRLILGAKDDVNEYFFVLPEKKQVKSISALRQSKKIENVIEIDALDVDGTILQYNIMLTSMRRFISEPGRESKLFHGIVLFDEQGYKRP